MSKLNQQPDDPEKKDPRIVRLEAQIRKICKEKVAAIKRQDFELGAKLRKRQSRVEDLLRQARLAHDSDEILSVVPQRKGIKALLESLVKRMESIEQRLAHLEERQAED